MMRITRNATFERFTPAPDEPWPVHVVADAETVEREPEPPRHWIAVAFMLLTFAFLATVLSVGGWCRRLEPTHPAATERR